MFYQVVVFLTVFPLSNPYCDRLIPQTSYHAEYEGIKLC